VRGSSTKEISIRVPVSNDRDACIESAATAPPEQ
jgi:hypothetical protein